MLKMLVSNPDIPGLPKAAHQGDTSAQCNLGLMYANGRGVAKDFEQAVFWYRKAAEQGNVNAQEKLTILGVNWKDGS